MPFSSRISSVSNEYHRLRLQCPVLNEIETEEDIEVETEVEMEMDVEKNGHENTNHSLE